VDLFRFLGIGLMAARKQLLANFACAGGRRQAPIVLAPKLAGQSKSFRRRMGQITSLIGGQNIDIEPQTDEYPCIQIPRQAGSPGECREQDAVSRGMIFQPAAQGCNHGLDRPNSALIVLTSSPQRPAKFNRKYNCSRTRSRDQY